ncbi:MAG TPA: choice-of-anchor J domain-containing protein [Bacteroidales bacterium]|nr:choice-of-anchor J domain-containing protein [Bacteroidales bacterium]
MKRVTSLLIVLLLWLSSATYAQPGTVELGAGTASNGTTASPTPYGTWYKNLRQQYLVLASELSSIGLVAGDITAIGFNVANVNTCSAMPNYTMKVKATTASVLTTTFDNEGYTEVWFDQNFLPVNGWNTHTFGSPFTWNGTSNLLVDVCFDMIPGSYSQNASVFYTPTATNLSLHYYSDTQIACGTTNLGTTSLNRANMQFTGVVAGCLPPTGIVAGDITNNSALISWTAGTASQWDVLYGIAGFNPLTQGTLVEGIANPSYSVTGLSSSTFYDVYVRTDCGAEVSSWGGPVNFVTLCGVYTLPFAENFDGATFPSLCWGRFSGLLEPTSILTATTAGWVKDEWLNVAANPDKAARVNIYGTTHKYWLVTPEIDLGDGSTDYQMEFDVALMAYGNNNPPALTGVDDKFAVVISLDGGVSWSSANTVRLWDNAGSTYVFNEISNLGQCVIISLADYSGIVKLAFYSESTISNADNDLMVNNLLIQVPPACPKPLSLIAQNPTINSIDLSWTPGGDETAWEISYGTPGFDPNTGTIVSAATNPFTLTGLSSATFYEVYVRADCGTDEVSSWAGPATFATACVAVNVPILQNFDALTPPALPLCWSKIVSNTTNTFVAVETQSSTTSHSLPNDVKIYNSGADTANLLLISPEIIDPLNTLRIKFWAKGGTNYSLLLGTMSDPMDAATFTLLNNFTVPANYAEYQYALTAYTGTDTYLAFKHGQGGTYHTIYLDDVTIELLPDCIEPLDVSVSDITTTTATIGWTSQGDETAWDITYGEPGFLPDNGTIVPAATNPFTITGLTANTSYEVYVRADCGTDEVSDWAGPGAFTTLCEPTDLPYIEDFESAIVPNLPPCTSREKIGLGNDWATAAAPGYGFTSKTLRYSYNSSYAADAWFYTNGMNLSEGVNYLLSFRYGNNNTSYVEKMKVALGTDPTHTAMTNVILDFPSINQGSPQIVDYTFTVPAAGVYYLGFNCYSGINEYYLYVDDIAVVEFVSGSLSGIVTEATRGVIQGALVTAGVNETYTDASGYYLFDALLPGTYDVTCEADGYFPITVEGVEVIADLTTTQDFELGYATISVAPESLTQTLLPGGTATQMLTISNTGGTEPLTWSGAIELMASKGQKVSIPAAKQVTGSEVSRGKAPSTNASPTKGAGFDVLRGSTGYAFDMYPGSDYVNFDTDTPGVYSLTVPTTRSVYAADFDGNNVFYAIDEDLAQLFTVDVATGVFTLVGSTLAVTDLAFDYTTNTMYAIDYVGANTHLFELDLMTGATTFVGDCGAGLIISLACDGNGDLYGFNVSIDNLVAINKVNGASTAIGPVGFDGNYAQSMAWDPASGNIYMAAFNYTADQGELRIVDITTGATALIGAFPAGAEICGLGFMGAIESWLSIDPISGIIAPGASQDITVTFDATDLVDSTYLANIKINHNGQELTDGTLLVPATLIVASTQPPDAPTLVSPVNQATMVPLQPEFEWINGAGTAQVQFEVRVGAGLSQSVYKSPWFVGSSINLSDEGVILLPKKAYSWTVKAKNAAGSVTSVKWTFTTIGAAKVSGFVSDAYSYLPLEGATITFEPGGYTATTAANGGYSVAQVIQGTYTVTAIKDGYNSESMELVVPASGEVFASFALNLYLAPPTNLQAQIVDVNNVHLSWISPDAPPPTSFSEGFEDTYPPIGWLKINPDGGTGWDQLAVGTTPLPGWTGNEATAAPNGGTQMVYATWTTGGSAQNDQWLVTPQIVTAAEDVLNFYMRYWFSSYVDAVDILISTTTQNNPAAFTTTVANLNFGSASSTDWELYTYNLSDFVAPGTPIYIAFREYISDNMNDGSFIALDNVYVGPPTDLVFAPPIEKPGIHSIATRDLNYVKVANPTSQTAKSTSRALIGFNVYRNENFLVSIAADVTEIDDLNLAAGTYAYTVKAVYPQGESEAVGPKTVAILAPPVLLSAEADYYGVDLVWEDGVNYPANLDANANYSVSNVKDNQALTEKENQLHGPTTIVPVANGSREVGDDCDNPIIITTLPYTDVNYTCGRGNTYENTCLQPYYDTGEDIIYQLTLTAAATIELDLATVTGYTGMLITTENPIGNNCIAFVTGYSGNKNMLVELEAGTYFIMIDTWSAPDCIPEFTLTVQEITPEPGQTCSAAVTAVEGLNSAPMQPYWYEFTPTESKAVTISSCMEGQLIDTKIEVYDACGGNLVAANDDMYAECSYYNYASGVSFNAAAGVSYKIFWLNPYSSAAFDFTIELEDLCILEMPAGAIAEGEPCIEDGGEDVTNGGCNMDEPMFTTINCGDVIWGTASTYTVEGGNSRDTDWYELVITEPKTVTFSVTAEFPVVAGFVEQIVPGVPGCDNTTENIIPAALADPCEEASVTATLIPGTYYLFVGMSVFEGHPCGLSNNYIAELTCEDAFVPYFNVYRNGVDIADVYGNTYYDDVNITNGQQYCYKVSEVVAEGFQTGKSNELCATIPMMPEIAVNPESLTETHIVPPAKTTTKTVTLTNDGQGTLNWYLPLGAAGEYCAASATNQDEYISNVLCGDINNSSGWQSAIGDYTAMSTNIAPGASEPIVVTNGNPWAVDKVTCWVDWNLDYEFGVGTNEEFILTTVDVAETFTGAIAVPAGTPAGDYRMRVRMNYSSNPPPCGVTSYGEVEEYTISVGQPWLSVDILEGTLAPGASIDIAVTFDSEGLEAGIYNDALKFMSNDPITPVLTVPVTFNVVSAPMIQNIVLPLGWSAWSSYITPAAPANVSDVMATVVDDMIITQHFTELLYPGYGINTMGAFSNNHGYMTKMAAEATLTISGNMANPTVQLHTGWNLIPVLQECSELAEGVFSNIDGFVIAWEPTGNGIYYPEYDIYTLTNLVPGKAYYVKVTQAGTFTYPGCDKSSGNVFSAPLRAANTTSWNDVIFTGVNHVVAFDQKATNNLRIGDMIGAFANGSVCAGLVEYTGANLGFTLFGNDITTMANEGFADGDVMTYKVFRAETGEEFTMDVVYSLDAPNSSTFAINGLSVITDLKLAPLSIGENTLKNLSIYPNPSSGIFNIAVSRLDTQIDYVVMNAQGQEIYNGNLMESQQLDLSSEAKGIYFIKFIGESVLRVEKLVIR